MFQGLFAAMALELVADPAERALERERAWTLIELVRRRPAPALLLITATVAVDFWQFPGIFAALAGRDVEKT